jgi:hypothetical protein
MGTNFRIAFCASLLISTASYAGSSGGTPSGAAGKSERLSEAEIEALAPGEYVGTWKAKKQLHLMLSDDGTVSGTLDGRYHEGQWHVSNGKLCIEFTIIIFEKTKCDVVYREGNSVVSYNKKGKARIRLVRADHDAEGEVLTQEDQE